MRVQGLRFRGLGFPFEGLGFEGFGLRVAGYWSLLDDLPILHLRHFNDTLLQWGRVWALLISGPSFYEK